MDRFVESADPADGPEADEMAGCANTPATIQIGGAPPSPRGAAGPNFREHSSSAVGPMDVSGSRAALAAPAGSAAMAPHERPAERGDLESWRSPSELPSHDPDLNPTGTSACDCASSPEPSTVRWLAGPSDCSISEPCASGDFSLSLGAELCDEEDNTATSTTTTADTVVAQSHGALPPTPPLGQPHEGVTRGTEGLRRTSTSEERAELDLDSRPPMGGAGCERPHRAGSGPSSGATKFKGVQVECQQAAAQGGEQMELRKPATGAPLDGAVKQAQASAGSPRNQSQVVASDRKARASELHNAEGPKSGADLEQLPCELATDIELETQALHGARSTLSSQQSGHSNEGHLVAACQAKADSYSHAARAKNSSSDASIGGIGSQLNALSSSGSSIQDPDSRGAFHLGGRSEGEHSILVRGRKASEPRVSSSLRERPKSELIISKHRRSSIGSAAKTHQGGIRKLDDASELVVTDSEAFKGVILARVPQSISQGQIGKQGELARLAQAGSSAHSSRPADLQSSSSSYTTAPLAQPGSSSNDTDYLTATNSTSTSTYETARSSQSNLVNPEEDSSTPTQENQSTSDMVSFSYDDRLRPLSQALSSDADTPTMTPNTEELEDAQTVGLAYEVIAADRKARSPSPGASCSRLGADIQLDDYMDEEQLTRILACKRLSEGCNKLASHMVQRKNSLHMIESMPPLTEGETMKHMSYHMSQNIDQSTASSSSSGSARIARPQGLVALKRGSQDENTSCSSSTSLDRSPSRRRSSTVSQCSSVLSESARNQLNFDMSPDLPPDSSILEANAVSPVEMDRPMSPEPNSFSGDYRPLSRMSPNEVLVLPSPDSTLGDSNDNEAMEEQMDRITRSCWDQEAQSVESSDGQAGRPGSTPEKLERLISEVSAVVVSADKRTSSKRPASDDSPEDEASRVAHKSGRSMLPRAVQSAEGASSSSKGMSPIERPRTAAEQIKNDNRCPATRSRTLVTPSPSILSSSSSSGSSRSSGARSQSRVESSERRHNGKPGTSIEHSNTIS